MPKYKVVVSMGVQSAVVEADNEEQAKEKAGEIILTNLEKLGDSIFEIYNATEEDEAEFLAEQQEASAIS